MGLDEIINYTLGNILPSENIENIKNNIKENFKNNKIKYEDVKINLDINLTSFYITNPLIEVEVEDNNINMFCDLEYLE